MKTSNAAVLSPSSLFDLKHLRVLAVAIALSFALVAVPAPAHAAPLNQTQISAILSLLQSFGANQNTINNVSAALNGTGGKYIGEKGSLSAVPISGPAPLTVAFTTSYGMSPSIVDATYSIDFGDGSAQNITCDVSAATSLCYAPVTVQHTYSDKGTYTAAVHSNDRIIATQTIVATNDQATSAPTVTIDQSSLTINAPQTVSAPLTNSTAPSVDAMNPPTDTQTLGALTSKQAFYTYLYNCVLGRAPDAGGLSGWVQGTINSFQTAYRGFFNSPEYVAANNSDQKFINQAYQCILFRTPDAVGNAFWLSKLQSGASRDSVVTFFAGSSEFQTKIAPTLQSVMVSSPVSVAPSVLSQVASVAVIVAAAPFNVLIDSLSQMFVALGMY